MPIEQAFESENEEAIYPWSIKRSMEYLEKMKREHLKEKKHAASHSLSPIDLSVSCPNHTSLLSNAVPTRLKDEKELFDNKKKVCFEQNWLSDACPGSASAGAPTFRKPCCSKSNPVCWATPQR